jgi:hypothetical protein
MPKPPASRNLTDVASLARRHTEACINVLFDIVSKYRGPLRTRTKAAKILRSLTEKARRNVPFAENKPL